MTPVLVRAEKQKKLPVRLNSVMIVILGENNHKGSHARDTGSHIFEQMPLEMPVSNTATCRLFTTAKCNEDKLSPCPDGSIKEERSYCSGVIGELVLHKP